jgi:hypothetical protein
MEDESKNNYVIYLFIRIDVIVTKPINLINCLDKYIIVTRNTIRPCEHHNRYWDSITLVLESV